MQFGDYVVLKVGTKAALITARISDTMLAGLLIESAFFKSL